MKRYALSIEVAAVAVIIAIIIALGSRNAEQARDAAIVPPPEMTELMTTVLASSKGFQHLISYTDRGFEPNTLSIKVGETVRFTNNSSDNLWVAAQAREAGLYPRGANESCGQSAFDSCVAMQPMEFWEFTFDTAGEWGFVNNGNAEHTGVIVTVQ